MAAYTYRHFRVTFPADFVAHVEINRPERLNAFVEAMWLEIRDIFDRLSLDESARAVVFSGAGPKAFTAGLDIQDATQNGILADQSLKDPARKASDLRRHIRQFQDCISSIERCEKRIDLSVCADIRLCTSTTNFAVKEVDLGLAADIGTLSRLPKCVGSSSWVKDVCLTARTFHADEAYRVGFVSGVLDTKEKAIEEGLRLATVIASKSPVAVQGTKEILNHSRDRPVEDGLRYTAAWNGAALQTHDLHTAMKSAITKQGQPPRRPRFEKL